MKKHTPDVATHLLKDHEKVYTSIGQSLRKYSIDKFPQLINIFIGDMVFIGTRPALHNQADLINLRIKESIHLLKPDITGWAQIQGRDELS